MTDLPSLPSVPETWPGSLLVDPDWLSERIDRTARVWGGRERRTNATLWWYSASVVLLGPAVRSLVLTGAGVRISPAEIRFTTRSSGYLERVIPGAELDAGPDGDPAAALGRHLDVALAPVIELLAAAGGATERSLWAIAADSLASVVLAATAVTPGGSATAAAVAGAIAGAGERLRPLPRFVEIPTSGGAVARYVHRGSCCLLYRVPDGKCLSCPNQTPAERRARLVQHAESG